MTTDQLQATRATRWRQDSHPILTLDDAEAWLQQTGLCLFLPRHAQLPAPAPSFVEACMGEANPTPPRAAIETARELLSRLIDANLALPLNLLGTPADHPDFLVSPDTLPFVFAMRGDRDWKHAPGSGTTRVSPLVQQVWKVLERQGVLSADEIKDAIGRELTEAAALRALYELWAAMRVTPLYQSGGEPTLWEALETRQQKALNAGTNMSQVTALSVLVSLYLESAVAATGTEVEIFLSPLTSRSKVREAVRGLTATRQLMMLTIDHETLLHVEGSLPDFEQSFDKTLPGVAPVDVKVEGASPVGGRVPRRPFAGAAPGSYVRSSDPASPSGTRPSIRGRSEGNSPGRLKRPSRTTERLPDTISVWPRPAPEEQTTRELSSGELIPGEFTATPHQQPRERIGGRFAPSARGSGGERTPARPPWKDKGKPGYAKSKAAHGDKARWPRERAPGAATRSAIDGANPSIEPLDKLNPGPEDRSVSSTISRPVGKRMGSTAGAPGDLSFRSDRSFGGKKASSGRPARGDSRGNFKSRSDSRPGTEKAFRPSADRPAGPRPAGSREGSPYKVRGDFKDFKARKRDDFRRSSPSAPARPGSGSSKSPSGGFKPSSRGSKTGGFKPPAGRPHFTGSRGGFKPTPGGEFRQPWKDHGKDREAMTAQPSGTFHAREEKPVDPASPFERVPTGKGDRGERDRGERRSFSRPSGSVAPRFQPRSPSGAVQRSVSGSDRRPYGGSSPRTGDTSGAPAGPRTFGKRPPSEQGRSRPGEGRSFKGGFKKPGSRSGKPAAASGAKPWMKSEGEPETHGGESGKRPAFARPGSAGKPGGFGKRSGSSSGSPSYKGSSRPDSRGSGPRNFGRPTGGGGRPSTGRPSSRPAGAFPPSGSGFSRPKRKKPE